MYFSSSVKTESLRLSVFLLGPQLARSSCVQVFMDTVDASRENKIEIKLGKRILGMLIHENSIEEK